MTNKRLFALTDSAKTKYAAEIMETDANPEKWYELHLFSEEDGSQTFESADTFEEVIKFLPQYVGRYPGQSVAVDVWENREHPNPLSITLVVISAEEPFDGNSPHDDRLCISDEVDEVIEVYLDPEKHPDTFARKVRCLQSSGLTKEEAEVAVMKTPIYLSLFYSLGQGLFAVENEAVDCISIYNPYDGKEILKINEQ